MITRVSALLDRRTRLSVLFGPDHARAASAIAGAGMSLEEISGALNCSFPLVQRFLMPTPMFWADGLADLSKQEDLRHVPRNLRVLVPCRPSRTTNGRSRKREQLAGHLAKEVSRWLSQFQLADHDRLRLVEYGRSLLDNSGLNAQGIYVFNSERAIEEILGIWRPSGPSVGACELNVLLGRWLASWIRFWISDSRVWARALDITATEFESNSESPAA
jgi:hypothetical protein